MFMVLAGSLLDAGIGAWDAKRAHDYVRPATAIPSLYTGQEVRAWAGPNLGSRLIDGAEWRPYQATTFVTPPFAEYVSGHSAFSAAAAEVLTGYTGSGRLYDGVTRLGRDYDGDGVEDLLGQHVAEPGSLAFEQGPSETVVLRWTTFREAADEAGISRLYGGIHFQDGDLRGRDLGREVGRMALAHAVALWDPPPTERRSIQPTGPSGTEGMASKVSPTSRPTAMECPASRWTSAEASAPLRRTHSVVPVDDPT